MSISSRMLLRVVSMAAMGGCAIALSISTQGQFQAGEWEAEWDGGPSQYAEGVIQGVGEIAKVYPTGAASDVLHYDNAGNHSHPTVAEFAIDMEDAEEWDRRLWCDPTTGDYYYSYLKAPLEEDQTSWRCSPVAAGDFDQQGYEAVFLPSTDVYQSIDVFAEVFDDEDAGNTEDDTVEVQWTGALTTFKVGVKLENMSAAGDQIVWEDQEDAESLYDIISDFSDLECYAGHAGRDITANNDRILSVTDDSDIAAGWDVQNLRWTAIAASSGGQLINNIQGKILSDSYIRCEGGDIFLEAENGYLEDVDSDTRSIAVEFGIAVLPNLNPWVKAATVIALESAGNAESHSECHLAGQATIEGLGNAVTIDESLHWTAEIIPGVHPTQVDKYDIVSVDMSDLSLRAIKTSTAGSSWEGSISFEAAVYDEDDAVNAQGWCEIRGVSDEPVQAGTSRPRWRKDLDPLP